MFIKLLPDQEYLALRLGYSIVTGEVWYTSSRGTKAALDPIIGRAVYIDKVGWLKSRVIWKLVTGEDPPAYIDHHDGNKQNNAWLNLRDATPSQNSQNKKVASRSKTGLKGVRCHGKYFTGRVNIKGSKPITSIIYKTAEEAHAWYPSQVG